ncbi:MAG TPA: tRNA pseudouridine(55) synthase TruB [Pyrinomonadaceae bacterium]
MRGAIVIDKPAGLTSHDVVARVRKILGERRVGHTGTLDPFATGVLVLLIGAATRLGQFLAGAEKEYEAIFRLGFDTDTGDATGTRMESRGQAQSPRRLGKAEIEAALAALCGAISQTPPMYSAKKIGGRKLYEFAREGVEVERKPVAVDILKFEALTFGDLILEKDATVDLPVRVVCSAGTYIRTLAEDFGKQLGIGAHVSELRRTRAGRFTAAHTMTIERLAELTEAGTLAQVLISPDETISHLPFVQLSDAKATRIRHGIDLKVGEADSWGDGQFLRLRDQTGNLIAVGRYSKSEATVHPSVVVG